jgi:succinyl-diaminopimelate desuccinylase
MMEQNNLIPILSKLVAFPTVSGDYKSANDCIDFIDKFLVSRDMKVNRFESNGYPSIVATCRPTKKPKVLLQAHLDVVPTSKKLYKLAKKDNRLIGRGVFDMKFAAAIYMQVAEELRPKIEKLDFGIMLTTDEEVGGEDGVEMLLDSGYGADICVLPDGGDNWCIETSIKGAVITKLVANGKSAHGSRPWEGDNAIDRLLSALSDVRKLFEKPSHDRDTLSINKVFGGTVINQVADKAEATLDMRFVSDESQHMLKNEIAKIAKKNGCSLDKIVEISVSKTDTSEKHVASFLKIAEEVRGVKIKETKSLGASDARFFAVHKIPTVVMRPEGGASHSDHEWINKKQFYEYYQLVKKFVERESIRP